MEWPKQNYKQRKKHTLTHKHIETQIPGQKFRMRALIFCMGMYDFWWLSSSWLTRQRICSSLDSLHRWTEFNAEKKTTTTTKQNRRNETTTRRANNKYIRHCRRRRRRRHRCSCCYFAIYYFYTVYCIFSFPFLQNWNVKITIRFPYFSLKIELIHTFLHWCVFTSFALSLIIHIHYTITAMGTAATS